MNCFVREQGAQVLKQKLKFNWETGCGKQAEAGSQDGSTWAAKMKRIVGKTLRLNQLLRSQAQDVAFSWNIFIPLDTLLPSLFPCTDDYFTFQVSGLTLSQQKCSYFEQSPSPPNNSQNLFVSMEALPTTFSHLFVCLHCDCLSYFPIAHFHFISSLNSMKSSSVLLECLIYSRYSLEVWFLLMLSDSRTGPSSLTQETQADFRTFLYRKVCRPFDLSSHYSLSHSGSFKNLT